MAKGKFSSPRKRGYDMPAEPEMQLSQLPELSEQEDVISSGDAQFLTELEFSQEELYAPLTLPEEAEPEEAEPVLPEAPQPESPAPAPEKNPASPHQLLGYGLIALLSLAVVIVSFLLVDRITDPYDCRILPNVTVAGVDVGEMTPAEARKALGNALEASLYTKDLAIVLPEGVLRLSPEDTEVKVDIRAAVKTAYNLGRTGSEEEQLGAYEQILAQGQDVSLTDYIRYEEAPIRAALEGYAAQFDTAYEPFTYGLTGDIPALAEESFNPDAPTQTLVLSRGMVQRELDVEEVLAMVPDVYGQNQLLLEIPEIVPLKEPELPDFDAILEEFSSEPVSADVSFETYQPVPATYGYTFDVNAARRMFNDTDYGGQAEIPMEYVEPELLSDEVFFRDVLGSCDTKHTTNENRNNNLRLLCEALDGLILEPGAEFSYNDSVGERTTERGYLPAGAYSGTTLVDAVGGGVCQGSTTLYNCVLLADLEIIFRVNHGYAVSYVPYGLDATVNWGGPDFQFRNSSNFPIMIKAEVSDGYVRMQLLGTDEKDYYVEMDTEYGVGETAIYARSYKCKYSKETGELISRELEARSNYMLG